MDQVSEEESVNETVSSDIQEKASQRASKRKTGSNNVHLAVSSTQRLKLIMNQMPVMLV